MADPELGPAVLAPVHFALPTAAETTANRLRWDSTTRLLYSYDGTRERPLNVQSWLTHAFPNNHPQNSTFGTGINLAAVSAGNGGAMLVPMFVPAPMLLQTISFRCTNTSAAKTAEARLYLDTDNAATINAITGSDVTWSFTAAAAADQESGACSGAGTCIVPAGLVWLAFRNTSTSQTVGIGSSGLTFGGTHLHYEQSIAALGSTLNAVTSWTAIDSSVGFRLNGRVLGKTTVP